MDTTIKSPYNPSNLSYYTTWWLASTSSISSENTLSSVLDNDVPVVTDRKKQKISKNQIKTTCCIPIKIFR